MRRYRSSSITLFATGVLAVAALVAPAAPASGGWQVVPSPGDAAGFAATSFVGPSDGWAVGSIGPTDTAPTQDPLIEHWNGSVWAAVPSNPIDYSAEALTGVAAPDASDAWAVGWQDPYGTVPVHGLMMRWDGRSWSVIQGAPGAGIPVAVAARSNHDVWAVGAGFVEHFDGTRWSLLAAPRSDAHLVAVLPLSPTSVWVAGSRPAPGTGYRQSIPYAAHWNGSTWKAAALPVSTGDLGSLSALTAASRSDIWAVGSDGNTEAPLALHYDGAQWRRVPTPAVSGSSGFAGVTAVAGDDVWAVGARDGQLPNGYAVERTLTEHWNGHAWSVVASRNDTNSDNFLTAATAVGGTVWAFGGDGGTLAERR